MCLDSFFHQLYSLEIFTQLRLDQSMLLSVEQFQLSVCNYESDGSLLNLNKQPLIEGLLNKIFFVIEA